MVQATSKFITINEFLWQYGDKHCYELIDGELIEMEPIGLHEQVAGFLGRKLLRLLVLTGKMIMLVNQKILLYWVCQSIGL